MNPFIFFKMAVKNAGSTLKSRVGRVALAKKKKLNIVVSTSYVETNVLKTSGKIFETI